MDELISGNSSPTQRIQKPAAVKQRAVVEQSDQIQQAKAVETAQKLEAGKQARIADQRQSASESRDSVKKAVEQLNTYIQSVQRSLQFEYDEDAKTTIVRVVDRRTNELIRQIPDEQAIKLARNLNLDQSVQLLNEKA